MAGDGTVVDGALATYVFANCWGLFICLEGWTGQEKSMEWPFPGDFPPSLSVSWYFLSS